MASRTGLDARLEALLIMAEEVRSAASAGLQPGIRRDMGQFFTPRAVAERIAADPALPVAGLLRVLDPGAGTGILTAALVARVLREVPQLKVRITAVEADPKLLGPLEDTLAECVGTACEVGGDVTYRIVAEDFVCWSRDRLPGVSDLLRSDDSVEEFFDLVIQNPPYRKIRRKSPTDRVLATLGVEVPNIYAAFLALGANFLSPGGRFVAITPRSFANGSYFKAFRCQLLSLVALERLSVFHDRGSLFAESAVLQENIIVTATRCGQQDKVVIATARGYADTPVERTVSYEDIVHTGDREMFLHIPTDSDDHEVTDQVRSLPGTLATIGVGVATGRVVDFRAKAALRDMPGRDTAPLIYPGHLRAGRVRWPIPGHRKPNALCDDGSTAKLLLPTGTYVLVKRFSSKEETRRIVACVFRTEDAPYPRVGFENHLNVFHVSERGLDPTLAFGLALWLNSTVLDLHFRQFSGHTQVNATDLRNVRYPSRDQLQALGEAVVDRPWPDQDEIDSLVSRHVLSGGSRGEAGVAVGKIEEPSVEKARDLLRSLNFDAERSNDRSGLVLRALSALRPDEPWASASAPLLRTVEIMDWIRQFYGRDYKPNTRETIRRFTLHQFAAAGLVHVNPDKPDRPVNSPQTCYQLSPPAIEVIRGFGSSDFARLVGTYLANLPGIVEAYATTRNLRRIPVSLPGGRAVTLSPGGQNELVREMIDEFCSRYTPGGQVLYVGDADTKWMIHEATALAQLGVTVDTHGKMPDLVVYLPDRNWLVLLEAASSHGPVDSKRHSELRTLFAGSTAGLVFVSCFPSRAEMRRYLKDIAWETEVWCADSPDHMVHFNGERFLGPYEV